MTELHRVGMLEITQDLPFQQTFWKVERVGWLLMGLLLLLAVLGLLGGTGPLNQRQVGSRQQGISVSYDPLVHRDASAELTMTIYPDPTKKGTVFISSDYLDKVQVKSVTPQPETVKAVQGGVVYTFAAPQADQLQVHFYVWPDNLALGLVNGLMGPSPERAIRITQGVYP